MNTSQTISVIVPFYNEEESLTLFLEQVEKVVKELSYDYELVFANDGSTDNGPVIVEAAQNKNNKIHLYSHRKRSGKGRALATGFLHSKGDIIIFIDADLQNDPKDLPKFIEKIALGYEFVNGYRKVRNDGVDKTLPSKIYNTVVSNLFSLHIHDINCGFKAMKREVLDSIQLYGDNYRILPILAKHEGFRITEVEILHHPREFGASKYGASRLLFGLFDMLTYFFLLRFLEKPLHFFGVIGTLFLVFGSIILGYLAVERIFFQEMLYRRPILFLGMLLVVVGVQIITTGFIGELIVFLHKKKDNS